MIVMQIIFIFSLLYSSVISFNLDLDNPTVFNSTQSQDYFGFSVGLFKKETDSWVLVGAPRGNTTHGNTGTTYKCSLDQKCEQFTDLYSNITAEYNNNFTLNGMHGFSIDSTGDEFIVCGPRAGNIRIRKDNITRIYSVRGECYKFNKNNSITKLQPLIGDDDKNSLPYFRFGEAGISVFIHKNTSTVIFGAPNVYVSSGAVGILYENTLSVIDHEKIKLKRLEAPYIGYSVTAGYVFGSELFFVSGVPRINKAVVYNIKSEDKNTLKTILQGEQSSEYFGASLTSCNINGDDYDDFIIGAPLFTKDKFKNTDGGDEGKIYIYHGGPFSLVLHSYVEGYVKNGRFGTSTACLGDLDQDGYKDIAVSAPYENSGVVYIYNGGKNGLITEPSQIIRGNSISTELRRFGYSISRGLDIDGNNYPDIAIGSYRSGHAVLLRSRPVLELSVKILGYEKLDRNANFFNITICSEYGGKHLPKELAVIEELETDPRKNRVFPNSTSVKRTLSKDNKSCRKETLYLEENILDYFSPITLTVSVSLSLNETCNGLHRNKNLGEDFYKECPIKKKSDKKITSDSKNYYFDTSCDNQICKTDLALKMSFNNSFREELIIGTSKSITFNVEIKHNSTTHPAYRTYLTLKSPINFVNLKPFCIHLDESGTQTRTVSGTGVPDTVKCLVGNPLEKGITVNITFELDTSSINYTMENITIKGELTSAISELKTTVENITIAVKSKANISIERTPVEPVLFLINKNENKSENINFTYYIKNNGPSPINEMAIKILVPTAKANKPIFSVDLKVNGEFCKQDTIKYETVENEQVESSNNLNNTNYPEERKNYINCTSNHWKCQELICKIMDIKSQRTKEVFVNVKINLKELGNIIGVKDMILYNTLIKTVIIKPNINNENSGYLDNGPIEFYARKKNKFDIKIIMLSVIGGLVILLLLTTGLVKAGFFRRKEKEALVQLKRQTQLEWSAMQRATQMLPPIEESPEVIDEETPEVYNEGTETAAL